MKVKGFKVTIVTKMCNNISLHDPIASDASTDYTLEISLSAIVSLTILGNSNVRF
jgi:hypothetical protein